LIEENAAILEEKKRKEKEAFAKLEMVTQSPHAT
jgi:hypothetical protein